MFELARAGVDIEVIRPALPDQAPRASDEVHRAVTEFFRPRGPEREAASLRFCELTRSFVDAGFPASRVLVAYNGVIPPDEVEAAAGALRALLADGTRRQRLAAAARDDARRFIWRRRAHAIDDFLHRVA